MSSWCAGGRCIADDLCPWKLLAEAVAAVNAATSTTRALRGGRGGMLADGAFETIDAAATAHTPVHRGLRLDET